MLTTAQLQAIKAAINADPALSAQPNTNAGNSIIAGTLNAPAVPAFVVWRSSVTTDEVGNAVNYVAVEAMTDANRGRITAFYTMNPASFSPARSDIRTYWANTFSGALGGQGQATRDALEALWRRNATAVEKILATGTGTTVSPATLGYEGTITPDEIERARSL
jgi:hypothetical protein